MRQRTVLLVNDTAASESLTRSLHEEGFSVVSAADQHEAFSKFEANKIDLILLDVDLGHKLGWDAFKRLAGRVPLVVIRATQSGGDGEKPFSVPGLFSVLPHAHPSGERAFQTPLLISASCATSARFRQTPGHSTTARELA